MLTCMLPQVESQILRSLKQFPTGVALVVLACLVALLMQSQRVWVGEHLVAVAAMQHFVFSVGPHVAPESVKAGEALPTLAAHVLHPLDLVHLGILPQVLVHVGEELLAGGTGVQVCLAVDSLPVFQELGLVRESLAAEVARDLTLLGFSAAARLAT